jgi:hypothetical protein
MAEAKTIFEKLYAIDVNGKTEKKGNLTYLSWAWAWAEFKKICPDGVYEVKKFDGIPYVYDPNTGYMVYTSVTAGGVTHEKWLPVMDSKNKALKQATMFEINKTIMRCLTKNLAMFGLGLYIYAGEDLPEEPPKEYKCCDCGEPFKSFTSKDGKTYNAGQVYHLAIASAKKKGITDEKARCSKCLEKLIAEKETGNNA